ncbi:MAG: rubrerythrin family protein [Promethearchaeota archaeon]
MTKSEDDLKAAFAGESQANRKYLAFAKKADQEGFPNVAKLFRAAAAAETVHAHAHLRQLKGIKSTLENLKEAVGGEYYELSSMYPDFIKDAKGDGNKGAEMSFNYALAAEKVHHKLYEKALKAVENGKDRDAEDIYVCSVCGMTFEGKAPDKCPVCGAPKEKIEKID